MLLVAATSCICAQSPTPQQQIRQHLQALSLARSSANRKSEANELGDLGMISFQAGQIQEALDFFSQKLPICRELGDRLCESNALINMATSHDMLGKQQRALDLYNQALRIQREIGDRRGESKSLNDMGKIDNNLGQPLKAIELENQALLIEREIGDRGGEAATLSNLGASNHTLGQEQKALDFYLQALPILREVGYRRGEGINLNNIGATYDTLGQKQKALDFLSQALSIRREVSDRRGEARTLGNIGNIYRDLNQKQEALEFYSQALSIAREVGDRRGEGINLNNIGAAYADLGQKQRALDFYTQALPIRRDAGDRVGEAETLSNIGAIYGDQEQSQKALEYYNRALPIAREVGDRAVEASIMISIARASNVLGLTKNAVSNMLAALSLAKEVGDPILQGSAGTSLMKYFREQKASNLAIFYGVGAVNAYEQIRKNISGMDKGLQEGFTTSKSETYRILAELLVENNRLSEAAQVLDLLKTAELKETVRGAADDLAATAPLPRADHAAEVVFAAEGTEAASLTNASFEFERLNAIPNPTPTDKAKLKDLSAKIAAGNAAIDTFFNKTLYEQLGGDTKSNARASTADTETSSLSNLLAQLGPGTLALYTLVGDQHSYLIVTTANTRTRYEIKTSAADLGKLILALRQELKSPAADPSKDLATLSHLLLDPIAADLATAARQSPDHIPTLLWSLDGVLRYVPMSALFDPAQPAGRQYLVERARNVIITPESRNHLLDAPSASLSAVGFGLSKSYENFPALSGVSAELNAVVHDPTVAASHGPLTGKLMRDDAFTLTALEANLRTRPAVVHIASHFVFQSGKSGESYLLLGGEDTGGAGYELTMSRLQTDPQLSFRGTRLLTLSACSTAEADTTSNGREIDSLGMVLQKRDAAAVLATLWDVNDASTSLLMSDFYRRWAATPNIEKIEALRQAQIALLEGPASSQQPTTARGLQIEAPATSPNQTKYSHPYFWAPFVLIGNYR